MSEPNELSERGPNNELLYRIPFDTPAQHCNRPNCGMQVWWVLTKNNKRMIVDVSIPLATRPPSMAASVDGVGASHWGQCKDREFVRGHKK